MDDFMSKFKALTSKEKFGVYAGVALVIGSYLPFAGWDFGFGYSANIKLTYWGLGYLAVLGGIAGVAGIFMKQPLWAAIGFAAGAVGIIIALLDTMGTEGAGLKFGAFIVIAAAAVGVWATIDALIAKMKEKKA